MNHLILPSTLAGSTARSKMTTHLLDQANSLIKTWLALTEHEDYRQNYKAVEHEFVILCTLKSRLIIILQTVGLPPDIKQLTQRYLEKTEELCDEAWTYARKHCLPEEALTDATYVHQ